MLKRLPEFQAVLQVYAVIAVMFSAWTIIAFLWKLSAWLLLLNLGEVFAIFSYGMLANLLESLLVLLLLLVVSLLLPPQLLRDHFVVRGTVLAMGLIGSLMAFVSLHMQFGIEPAGRFFIVLFETVLLVGVVLGFSPKFRRVHSLIQTISDRMTVFLVILVPLFFILGTYVVVRIIR